MVSLFRKILKKKRSAVVADADHGSQPSTNTAHYETKTPKPKRRDEYDIKEWFCPDNPTVDVCFLHGLTGNRDETWTAHGAAQPWPQAFLPERFPNARLLTFGYDADVVRGAVASKDTIGSLAEDFLEALTCDREDADALHRPIVFVAHSLGGIVCKRAITLSYQKKIDPVLGSVAASLVGVIFMGTPHSGSYFADVAGWFVAGIGFFKSANRNLLEILERGNDVAADIDVCFLDVCAEVGEGSAQKIQIFCFYEILPLPAFGNRVVTKDSATYRQHRRAKIHANHMDMVRFPSSTDPGYKKFCRILQRFVQSPRKFYLSGGTVIPPSPPPTPPSDDDSSTPDPVIPLDDSQLSGPSLSGPGQQQQQQRHTADPSSSASGNGNGNSNNSRSVVATAQYYLPFQKNPNFVGRESVLEELQARFFEDNHPQIALRGLGGVGKTQVANEMAHRVKQTKPEYSVFWVPALSISGFQKAYEAIAAKLNLRANLDLATDLNYSLSTAPGRGYRGCYRDMRDIKDVVCEYLSSDEAGHWLMVVDGADELELVCGKPGALDSKSDSDAQDIALGDYIPKSDKGRVLFTSRTGHVATSLAGITVVLDEFDLSHSRTLASKLFKRKQPQTQEDEDALDDMLRELGFLPLAITQAMAYLNVSGLSTTAYLGLLRGTEVDRLNFLFKETQESAQYGGSRRALCDTWLVSFDQLQKRCPGAIELLGFLSQIHPKSIPLSLLPHFGSSNASTISVATELCEYSFITMHDNGTLDMHSLVHLAARHWFDKSDRSEQMAQAALKHVDAIFRRTHKEHHDKCGQLLPHVLHIVRDIKMVGVDVETACRLGLEAGCCLLKDENYADAVECLESCAAWAQESVPEMRLCTLIYLGTAYNWANQHTKALDVLERASYSSKNQDHSARYTTILDNQLTSELGRVYCNTGQYKKAVSLLEQTVGTKTVPDDKCDYWLASLYNLGCAYYGLGRLEKAMEWLEHVVHVQEYLAEDAPRRLEVQALIARLHHKFGRPKEAISLMEKVFDVQRRSSYHGAEVDSLTIAWKHDLALWYSHDGQTQRALDLMTHVVSARNKLPEDDRYRLRSEEELAAFYFRAGRVKEAISLMTRVVDMRTATLPENDQGRVLSMHKLSVYYCKMGEVQKALKLMEQVVALRSNLPEENSKRLLSQYILARLFHEEGRVKEATTLMAHVFKVRTASLSKDDPDRLNAMHELSQYLFDTGERQKALEYLKQVVALQSNLPEDNPKRLRSQFNLAFFLYNEGHVKEATTLRAHVFKVRTASLPKDDPERLDEMHELSRCFFSAGERQKALEYMEEVVALRSNLPEGNSSRLKSQHTLALFTFKLGQRERGFALMQSTLALYQKLPEDDKFRIRAEENMEWMREELAKSSQNDSNESQTVAVVEGGRG